MKKYKFHILVYILVFLFCCASLSLGQQLIDGIAAVVGREIILKSEVDQFVQNYVIQNKVDVRTNPEALEKLRKQVLDRIVEQKVLLTQAEEDTIIADERDIDKRVEEQLNYFIQQVGSEAKLEEAFQIPISKIKRNLRKDATDLLRIEILREKKFGNVKITRKEVENFFTTYKDSLPTMPETVDISHILKQIRAGGESRKKALEKIHLIQDKLNAGENFSDLAKQYSEDPASAKRSGDLGFTKRGDFVREYEEVAFLLSNGEVSDIVETQFGFHIIKLIEKRGEQIRTSHILIQMKPVEEDESRVVEELKSIRESYLSGAKFDSLAMIHSDDENVENDKGHLGLWQVDKLAIPAFKEVIQNLKSGEVSEPFKTEYGYHILKLIDHKLQREVSLETDWERIHQIALNYKVESEYSKWLTTFKKEIPIEYRVGYN